MLLHSLKLNNFGPFYREHSIALDVDHSAPVIVIHGENMRGKTSLVNAIRWCLYGKVVARTGIQRSNTRLMSYDAIDSGDNYMRAVLEFTHNGSAYELERHVQSDSRPVRDNDLQETVTLRRDGQFLSQRDIHDTIAGILHEEIARFFLFDGEMLAQYEALVAENTNTDLLRQSIERILGLPALQHALTDIADLQSDANRRQRRAVRRHTRAANLASEADQIESDLSSINQDIAELESQQIEKQQERDDLVQQRSRIASIEADVQLVEQLDVQIQDHIQNRDNLKHDIQAIVAESWYEPVASRASELLSHFESETDEVNAARENAAQLEYRISNLTEMLATGLCPVCDHQISNTQRPAYEDEVNDLQSRRREIPDRKAESAALTVRIRELRRFGSDRNLLLLQDKERRFRKTNLDIRKLQRDRHATFERLRGHDSSEIRNLQAAYDRVVGDLRELERELKLQRSKHEGKLADRSRVRQQISRLPEANPRITTESTVYDSLTDIYEETVDYFRDELRTIVEEQASDIFRQITTEPDYDRLAINERYGLEIVDTRDHTIHDRSAGAEQVVALALIAALNRAAVREGPIVMDTPFGRLDVIHRKNILEFIPTMGSQVIILVQSGEVDPNRDLIHLDGKIGRQFRLVRDGSPTRSRIERFEQ